MSSARTLTASPTIGTSTATFLPISAGSMSICIMLAFGANSATLPVVRSENLHPTAMRQSHLSTVRLATLRPCIPSIPRDDGWSSGNEPLPRRVVVTGAFMSSDNLLTSSEAPDIITPPPARITGFSDLFMSSAALFICRGCPLSVGL